MPSSFEAKMHIALERPSSVMLIIPTAITIPVDPDDAFLAPSTWANANGMCDVKNLYYHGKVSVTTQYPIIGTPTSIVQSIPGSGRGQMRLFDALVGPRLAELRLTESRRIRRLQHPDGDASLTVYRDEIARIEELLEGFFQAGEEGDFINRTELAYTA